MLKEKIGGAPVLRVPRVISPEEINGIKPILSERNEGAQALMHAIVDHVVSGVDIPDLQGMVMLEHTFMGRHRFIMSYVFDSNGSEMSTSTYERVARVNASLNEELRASGQNLNARYAQCEGDFDGCVKRAVGKVKGQDYKPVAVLKIT